MTLADDLDHRGSFQHGLVSRRQLDDGGATRQQRRTLVRKGVIVQVHRGVYRTCGTPPGWEQDMLAACLAAGPDAVASHRAAGLLWNLVDPPVPVEISVPYDQRRAPRAAICHRSKELRSQDVAIRHRIPVTAPARTLLDLGSVAPARVPDAVERCLYQRFLTTAALWRILEDLGTRGRRGAGPLRRALEQRVLGDERPESLLEPLLAVIIADTGVAFEYQFPVVLEGHRYLVDFAVPELLLACEVDGLSAHSSRDALDHDLERQNRFVRHGWMVLRFTATHLRRRRRAVQEEIRTAVADRVATRG